jgi:uncharacterized damage-inducible protein DinB
VPVPPTRPNTDEYAPYYQKYIDRVAAGDVITLLARQIEDTAALLANVKEADAGRRYAPGKWSIREVVGHVSDAERVFAYRALRFARGDEAPLQSFDENTYAAAGGFDRRTLADVVAELRAVRQATLALLRSLDEAALARAGTASGNRVTVRALAHIIAGHEAHHVAILKERYGVGA